jgi:TDG/mug DNA glycosylase family protein
MEDAVVWMLPNPSGRNRAFALDTLVDAYRQLYREAFATSAAGNVAKPRMT